MSAIMYGNLHGFCLLLKVHVGEGVTTLMILNLSDAVSASISSITEPLGQTFSFGCLK